MGTKTKHKPAKSSKQAHVVKHDGHDKKSHALPPKLKAALEAEKKIEAQAEKEAREAIVNGMIAAPAAVANPKLKHGVGEAIVSSGPVKLPPHIRRIRALMTFLIVVLIAVTATWFVLEKKHYNELHAPARQAAMFKEYDVGVSSLEFGRHYDAAVAKTEAYLNTKPNAPYRDKAALRMGDSLVNSRKYDKAIEAYKMIDQQSAVQLEAWRGLATAYSAKGDKQQTLAYLQKVVDALKAKSDGVNKVQLLIDEAKLDAAKQ